MRGKYTEDCGSAATGSRLYSNYTWILGIGGVVGRVIGAEYARNPAASKLPVARL